ncbi:MAG TPA: hypothetical protein PK402_02015, partial [Tepidisphaeraceae bacterium]|nr:hypothetical protein [Tepidisphaeraceae bacterium]
MQSLELRRMFSISLVGDIVFVYGTKYHDSMFVMLKSDDPSTVNIRMNDERASFSVADIYRIEVFAGYGNDKVRIDESHGAITLNTHIDGGKGTDLLIGASGRDEIYGRDDRDLIIGGAGRDLLFGNDG